MRLAGGTRFLWILALGILSAGIPIALLAVVGNVGVTVTAEIHFFSVGVSALVAAVAAAGLTAMGQRRGDTRTIVVGTAFAGRASLLALHGLSTPGVLVGQNGVVAITGGATLPVGGLSSRSPSSRSPPACATSAPC